MILSRPISAVIDLSALRHNLGVVRRHATASRVLAVIKADAYGHGAMRVARALAAAGVDGFALLEIESAIALRAAGFRQRLVLLEGFFDANEIPALAAHGIEAVVHCAEQITMLCEWSRTAAVNKKIAVLLKVNTGMNRLGFAPAALAEALAALRACPAVGDLTLMTHFANADDARGVDWQVAAFDGVTQSLALPRTMANSAAILRYPGTHADWVRAGIMLYGASPFADVSAASLGLKPVMTLTSRIIAVQSLRAGETVGYGGIYVAQRDTRVGVVACGYADGYPRHAPGGTPVRIDGVMTTTMGRVSMDMLCADITSLPGAGVGTAVTLWGEGNPVDDVATAAGTVGYELLCALAPRVPVVEHG